MGNLFSRFVIKDNKGDFLHSSGYAKAQNGSSMGAASTQSFEDRMKMEKNRRKIRGYNDSRIMTQVGNCRPRAQVFKPQTQNGGAQAQVGRPQAGNPPKNPSISR